MGHLQGTGTVLTPNDGTKFARIHTSCGIQKKEWATKQWAACYLFLAVISPSPFPVETRHRGRCHLGKPFAKENHTHTHKRLPGTSSISFPRQLLKSFSYLLLLSSKWKHTCSSNAVLIFCWLPTCKRCKSIFMWGTQNGSSDFLIFLIQKS